MQWMNVLHNLSCFVINISLFSPLFLFYCLLELRRRYREKATCIFTCIRHPSIELSRIKLSKDALSSTHVFIYVHASLSLDCFFQAPRSLFLKADRQNSNILLPFVVVVVVVCLFRRSIGISLFRWERSPYVIRSGLSLHAKSISLKCSLSLLSSLFFADVSHD